MHIVLFGGAFDPPHRGHIHVAKNFLSLNLADELVFLPVGEHAFSKNLSPAKDRLAMLEIIRENFFSSQNVSISDFEIKREGMSVTYLTLSELSQANPQNKYSFLMGSDNLQHFSKWHSSLEMLKKFTFYIYPREGYDFSDIKEGMIALEEMPAVKISSTRVKEVLKSPDRSQLQNLLDPEIISYINENKLYEN